MRGKVGTLAEILEVLFPCRCLLCGRWLLAGRAGGMPVCGDCQCALIPLQGRRCDICGTPLISEKTTCIRCRDADFAFSRHFSLFAYSGPARDLIASLKFERRHRLSSFFADILGPRILADYPAVPVVPVPGRRSADTVELIARRLQSRHGIEVLRLLQRSGGRPQKSLDLQHRRENLRGKIRLAARDVPDEALLFDDVFTTGATADTCARTLLEGGCRKVSVLSIAMEE